jgi:hypothetical protein
MACPLPLWRRAIRVHGFALLARLLLTATDVSRILGQKIIRRRKQSHAAASSALWLDVTMLSLSYFMHPFGLV